MVLFERGRAEIREEGHATLRRVAKVLKKRRNVDFKIVGHTSSWPLGPDADAENHLLLGFRRALAVAKRLEENEDMGHLRVILASQGNHVPSAARKNLWDDPEQDDRVEILFLPARD